MAKISLNFFYQLYMLNTKPEPWKQNSDAFHINRPHLSECPLDAVWIDEYSAESPLEPHDGNTGKSRNYFPWVFQCITTFLLFPASVNIGPMIFFSLLPTSSVIIYPN